MSTRISRLLFSVGEEFLCQREDGNRTDPFVVAVVRAEAMFQRRYLFGLSIYAGG